VFPSVCAALPGALPEEGHKVRRKARNLLEFLRDRSGQVLAFADRPEHVPFTNNVAERGLRPCKVRVKVSGCHQSEEGATAWSGVCSYVDSARKHGLSAFEALRRAFNR